MMNGKMSASYNNRDEHDKKDTNVDNIPFIEPEKFSFREESDRST
jgi:hypothetical protein